MTATDHCHATPAPLSVPRCDPCGEPVFDYLAERQITGALEATSTGLGGPANGAAARGT